MWLTRADIDFGGFKFKGWNHIFIVPKYVDDAFVALLAALILFLVPSKANRGEALLIWEDAKKLRYDIIWDRKWTLTEAKFNDLFFFF